MKNANDTKLGKAARDEAEKVLKGILEVCQIYHTPMFASIITENTDKGIVYDNIVYSAQSHQIRLTDDKIRRHMLVANGFETMPKINKETTEEQPKKLTVYKVTEDADKEIIQKLETLVQFSEKHQTSVFVAVAVGNSETDTEYEVRYNITENQVTAKNSQIKKHITIAEKSFDAVPVRDVAVVDMWEVFN